MNERLCFETPIALRAWPVLVETQGQKDKTLAGGHQYEKPGRGTWIGERLLIIDTETTADEYQNLRFGSFLLFAEGELLADGLFTADDLDVTDPEGFAAVHQYAKANDLFALTRSEFINRIFYAEAYRLGALVIGFNLPFDLMGLAIGAAVSEGENRNSFRLYLSKRPGDPDLRLCPLTPHATLIEFYRPAPKKPASKTMRRKWRPVFPGRFLDLHTLSYALTGESHNLLSAGLLFKARKVKNELAEEAFNGPINDQFLGYAMNDVWATFSLYLQLRDIYKQFPFATAVPEMMQDARDTPIHKLYSPASIAKAFLRKMGIPDLRNMQRDINPEYLGYAMAAFYGGRIEVRLRRAQAKAVLLDFSSQYPSVFTLLNLWPIIAAEHIEIHDATREAQNLLDRIAADPELLYDTTIRQNLACFAQITPQGDRLPVRAPFGAGDSNDLTAVNTSLTELQSNEPMWYGLPDLAASAILTGRAPRISRAFRSIPVERYDNLQSVKLGETTLSPSDPAIFTRLVEERKRLQQSGQESLAQGVKLIANTGCYGITVEFDRKRFQTMKTRKWANLYSEGCIHKSFEGGWEAPGSFCNPLIGSLVTSAGRLLIALLQHEVEKRGGSWLWTATDAMAVCDLTEPDIAEIQDRFQSLSPYNPELVLHFLKVEAKGDSYAIAGNRWCVVDERGEMVKASVHGLGGIIPPTPESPTEFARRLWQAILDYEAAQDEESRERILERFSRCIVRRKVPIRNVTFWRQVCRMQRIKVGRTADPADWKRTVKPFGFLQQASPPVGLLGVRFKDHPVFYAPYRKGEKESLKLSWWDFKRGGRVHIRPNPVNDGVSSGGAVETFADLIERFLLHPERKMSDVKGEECLPYTKGQLSPRPVARRGSYLIGKESDPLSVESEEEVSTDDDRVRILHRSIIHKRQPSFSLEAALRKLEDYPRRDVATELSISERQWRKIRAGSHTPRPQLQERIIRLAKSKPAPPHTEKPVSEKGDS